MPAQFSRRQFLATSAAWAAARGLGRGQDGGRGRTVSIIHTTDLHGHILPTRSYTGRGNLGGLARCATLIRQWRMANPHSLLVDVGDLYQGTAASHLSEGRLFVDLLARLDYDAWVLGNHDFDWGPEALARNLAAAKTSVLTANLGLAGKSPGELPGDHAKIIPWKMCETGGFRIALIGLVTPGLESWLAPETLGGLVPTDPSPVLSRSIAQAKSAQADAIVVLGHYGYKKADDYANPLRETLRHVTGADVWIGGHTHVHQPSVDVGGVLYSQATYHGIHLGRIDLTFDLDSRKLIAKTAVTELMDERYELDPAILQLARPDLEKSAEQLARKICVVRSEISGAGDDSPLFRLLCQTFREALEREGIMADAVFHGTFGTKSVPAGELTVGDAWDILPYDNHLVTASLSPVQLLEIIADETPGGTNRNLWPLRIVRENRKPVALLRDGIPVPADKPLTVAFNSYDAQSGDRSLKRLKEIIFTPAAQRRLTPIHTRDAFIEGLLRRQEI